MATTQAQLVTEAQQNAEHKIDQVSLKAGSGTQADWCHWLCAYSPSSALQTGRRFIQQYGLEQPLAAITSLAGLAAASLSWHNLDIGGHDVTDISGSSPDTSADALPEAFSAGVEHFVGAITGAANDIPDAGHLLTSSEAASAIPDSWAASTATNAVAAALQRIRSAALLGAAASAIFSLGTTYASKGTLDSKDVMKATEAASVSVVSSTASSTVVMLTHSTAAAAACGGSVVTAYNMLKCKDAPQDKQQACYIREATKGVTGYLAVTGSGAVCAAAVGSGPGVAIVCPLVAAFSSMATRLATHQVVDELQLT